MADWHNAYATMDPAYEAAQLGVLRQMLQRGLIFRGERPVHWSVASRTALAEAELDYKEDHASTSAYVAFELRRAAGSESSPLPRALDELLQPGHFGRSDRRAAAVIWTTTPWTIPANQAICVARFEYTLARANFGPFAGQSYLVATSRLQVRVYAAPLPSPVHHHPTHTPPTTRVRLPCRLRQPLSPSRSLLLLAGPHGGR